MKARKKHYIVDSLTGCWVGQVELLNNGYHRITVGGVRYQLHRYMYSMHKGSIFPGNVIDHLCKNKRCCNPEHLEQVSPTENIIRGDLGKLTSQDIENIKKLYKAGQSQKEISVSYSVHQCHISRIINNKRRRWEG